MKRVDHGLPPLYDLLAYMMEDVRRDLSGKGIASCVVSKIDEPDLDSDDRDRLGTLPKSRFERTIMEQQRLKAEAASWVSSDDFTEIAVWLGADPGTLRESLLNAS